MTVNLVDSCGWLEYFTNDKNAAFFAPIIEKRKTVLVPIICIYEVYKRIVEKRSVEDAELVSDIWDLVW